MGCDRAVRVLRDFIEALTKLILSNPTIFLFTMNTFNPENEYLLSEAREYVKDNLDDGIRCPCCNKWVRRYKRKFNTTMAKSLLWLVNQSKGNEWIDVPNLGPDWLIRSNQLPTTRWWGLIERPKENQDKKALEKDLKHSGSWRATKKGIAFAYNSISIPSTAITYDGNVEALIGKKIKIQDTVGINFSYSEIMSS
tara:strand:+ start:52 stop:639 length:588 start_codon:yes stop_codon:yes gene_type:complete